MRATPDQLTLRCAELDLAMPLIGYEYDELYWAWRDLAVKLERELTNLQAAYSIAKAAQEGRDGLG